MTLGDDARAARRQRLAALLLPAIAIGAVYLAVVRPKETARIERATRDLADARARTPSADALERLAAQADALRTEVREARESREASGSASPSAHRKNDEGVADWLARVSATLTAHGVLVLSDEATRVKLPPDLLARLSHRDAAGGAVRRMRLVGPYGAVVRALDRIDRDDSGRVVLGLTLDIDALSGALHWTLTIG